MSDLAVVECVNPEALGSQPCAQFFARAFSFQYAPDAVEAWQFLRDTIPNEDLALFFAVRDGEFVGMALIHHSYWVFGIPGPMILHFYCPKDEEARDGLGEALRVWSRARGASQMYACHRGPKDTDWFLSRFARVCEGRVAGKFLEFDLVREDPVAW